MRPGTVISLALFAFIGILAVRNQNKERANLNLKTQLTDTTRALRTIRRWNIAMGKTVDRLRLDSSNLSGRVAVLEGEKQAVVAAGYRARLERDAANARMGQTVEQMNALKKKQAADVHAGGLGTVSTTVDDSVVNGEFARLKGTLNRYETHELPRLQDALTTESGRAEQQEKRADKAESDLADLKRESAEGFSNVRTFVQDKRAEKSKGLIRKVVNAGQIKTLGEVDAKISQQQHRSQK